MKKFYRFLSLMVFLFSLSVFLMTVPSTGKALMISGDNVGIGTSAPDWPLDVRATTGYALQGACPNCSGVGGVTNSGNGVTGSADSGNGVLGGSISGNGVLGISSSGYGVYGVSSSSYAGYFDGPVNVTGNQTVGGSVIAASFSGNGSGLTNINGANIAAGTLGSGALASGAVTGSAIASGAVTDANIVGPISSSKIANMIVDANLGNTALGGLSLVNITSGGGNTAVGKYALMSNTEGYWNTAFGAACLYNNTTGVRNVAVGEQTLLSNVSGHGNVAVGVEALKASDSDGSVAIGDYALFQATGALNTAVGQGALYDNVGGLSNIAIGAGSGANIVSGSYNIDIGAYAHEDESNTTRIGLTGWQNKVFIAGIDGVTISGGTAVYINSNGQLGTITSSKRYKEDIKDMGDATSGLMKLRPVTFRYKSDYAKGPRTPQYGLIAEEVAQVYPDLVQYTEKGEPNAVYYQMLDSMLLNEVQKQQKTIEHLTKIVDEKDSRIQKLEKQLDAIEKRIAAIESPVKIAALK